MMPKEKWKVIAAKTRQTQSLIFSPPSQSTSYFPVYSSFRDSFTLERLSRDNYDSTHHPMYCTLYTDYQLGS